MFRIFQFSLPPSHCVSKFSLVFRSTSCVLVSWRQIAFSTSFFLLLEELSLSAVEDRGWSGSPAA